MLLRGRGILDGVYIMMRSGILMGFRRRECHGRKGMRMIRRVYLFTNLFHMDTNSLGWSTDSEVRKIPMPRDTPPATIRKPKPQAPEPIRAKTPPKAPKPVEKAPEPAPVP